MSAIIEIIRQDIKNLQTNHFDGNGYSDEWKLEAAQRGLDCEQVVLYALIPIYAMNPYKCSKQ